jgi:hypothetical protein
VTSEVFTAVDTAKLCCYKPHYTTSQVMSPETIPSILSVKNFDLKLHSLSFSQTTSFKQLRLAGCYEWKIYPCK